MKKSLSCRGYGLVEIVVSCAVVSLLILILVPTIDRARSQMHRADSSARLMMIGQGGAMYAQGNAGRLFSYSWRGGETYLMPDGKARFMFTDMHAAQRQNQEILQRLTGRFVHGDEKITVPVGILPHRRRSHLVLLDYLNIGLESTLFIDPADQKLERWHDNPLEYLQDVNTVPYGMGPDHVARGYDPNNVWLTFAIVQRWTFGSSYQQVPSAWQPDFPAIRYYPLANTPNLFRSNGDVDLHTGRRLPQVVAPSGKVWMFEEFDREQAGEPYFAYNHAQSEKLMFDGSVNSWRSGDAFESVVPENGGVWSQIYVPLHQFPIPLGGLGDPRLLNQRYRWTYLGLEGLDYGLFEPGRGPSAK